MSTKPELAISYAALILADEGLAITPEKLQSLITAAGITDVEPIWSTLFAKALAGKDVKAIMTDVSAMSAPVAKDTSVSSIDPDKSSEKDPEKPDEQQGQEDDGDSDSDIGMGLFDD